MGSSLGWIGSFPVLRVERATPDLRGFLQCCLPWRLAMIGKHFLFLLRKAELDHYLSPRNTATVQNEIGSTRTKKRNQLWYPLLPTQKSPDHQKNWLIWSDSKLTCLIQGWFVKQVWSQKTTSEPSLANHQPFFRSAIQLWIYPKFFVCVLQHI